MNILFVSHASDPGHLFRDPSVRYRCYNPAQDLSRMGHRVDVCHIRHLKKWQVDLYDAVIFHRPGYSRKLVGLLRRLQLRGTPCVADFDDLLFSEKHVDFSPLLLTQRASKRMVQKKIRAYKAALRLFDRVTVATEPLKDEVRTVHPQGHVSVIHNGLSMDWVRHAEGLAVAPSHRSEIGYLPGTRSHDHDMAFIKQAVLAFLSEHASWDMTVVGPLSFVPGDLGGRFRHEKPVHYYRLPLYLKRFRVTLAPLVDNPFNRCKSAIKYLESAAMGVPVLASPIPDMARFAGTGVQLCHTADEFKERLNQLTDHEYHRRVAEDGRQHVLAREMSMKYSLKLLNVLKGAAG